MEVEEYILKQPPVRQNVLVKIHAIIFEADKTVKPEVELMMGKEMPLDIVQPLIIDCSSIDLYKIREDYLKSKKAGKWLFPGPEKLSVQNTLIPLPFL
jgi:hypothetical protein